MRNAGHSLTRTPFPARPALTVSLLVLAVLTGTSVCGAQNREAPNNLDSKQPVLPRIFAETKINVRLKGVSLSQMLDIVIPANSPLNYVVEDLPIKTTADLTYRGPLKDALDHVADEFDYTWRVRKGTFVVFEKRFVDPDEHPQLILPELLKIARDVNTTLKGIPYQSGIANDFFNIRTLYLSLTPPQVSRLERKESLGVNDLSVAQTDLMITALYSSQYQSAIYAWQDLESQLAAMPKSVLVLAQYDRYGVLFYQYPAKGGRTVRKTLRLF
jgi:hypothetical protein